MVGFHHVWNSQWEGLGATSMGAQSISSQGKHYLSQASLSYTVTTAAFTSHTWSDSCYRYTQRGEAGASHSSYSSLLSHSMTSKFPSYTCHTFIPRCFIFPSIIFSDCPLLFSYIERLLTLPNSLICTRAIRWPSRDFTMWQTRYEQLWPAPDGSTSPRARFAFGLWYK